MALGRDTDHDTRTDAPPRGDEYDALAASFDRHLAAENKTENTRNLYR